MPTESQLRVKKLVNDYIDYTSNIYDVNGIAHSSPSTLGQTLIEFKGQPPSSSGYRGDQTLNKAAKAGKVKFTKDQLYAQECFNLMSPETAWHVAAPEFYKNKASDKTNEKHTLESIAIEIFKLSLDQYKHALQAARKELLAIDKKLYSAMA